MNLIGPSLCQGSLGLDTQGPVCEAHSKIRNHHHMFPCSALGLPLLFRAFANWGSPETAKGFLLFSALALPPRTYHFSLGGFGRVKKKISRHKSRRTQLVQYSKHDLLLASTCLTSRVISNCMLGPDTCCRTACVDIADALTSLIIDCISITHKTTRDVFHATHALARLPIAS